jgi:mRNA-degrading endonuclease YafQ of YafQ-DinJ toxin-antitoxin module
MQLFQKPSFQKIYKKFHILHCKYIDEAIRKIIEKPLIGEAKVGDLAGVRVFKFKIDHQLMLLAYTYEQTPPSITLLALGTHENFYRDLKK